MEKIMINNHYYNRYLKLINYWKTKKFDEGEFHHILPKCLGGDNSKENIIFIGYREHYIAHWILAKSIDDDKLWYAFNMMHRIANSKSSLYRLSRKYISKVVSNRMKGFKHTDAFKDAVSERTKNTLIVKDINGNVFRCNKNDPKYISGEYVFYRTGFKHKEKTLSKMRNNGLKNRIMCHNIIDGSNIYIKNVDDLPSNYKIGAGWLSSERAKNRPKNIWYTHLETMKYRRFKYNEDIPDGYVKGRKGINTGKGGKFGRITDKKE